MTCSFLYITCICCPKPVLSTQVLRLLLVTAEEKGGGVDQRWMEEEQFQKVAETFCARLARDFAAYQDVTVPQALAVYELRLGLRMVAFQRARAADAAPAAEAALAGIFLLLCYSPSYV